MFIAPRNPNIAKWDIIFDKKTTEWISFRPQLGLQVYPCYACRAMFGSKNSFLDHVNRRGMVLKYKCSLCKCSSFFEFYNPCAFLLHTRQHYNLIEGHINLDNLEVQALPFGLGGFLPDPTIPMIYNVKDDNVGESTFINTRFYNPIPDSKGQAMITVVPNELLFLFSPGPNVPSMSLVLKQMSSNIPRCKFINLDTSRFTPIPQGVDINGKEIVNECNEVTQVKQEDRESQNNFNFSMPVITKTETIFENNEENTEQLPTDSMVDHFPHCPECGKAQTVPMNEHFIKSNKSFEIDLKCSMCKYIAPTKCSLKAHERIHKTKAPYVCPECGKDFDNCTLLYLHLGDVCFHLTKQVRHRCPGKRCGKIFAQLSTFAAHFLCHFNKVFSCTLCIDTHFFSEDEFLEHSTIHDSKQCPAKRLFFCTVCNDTSKLYNKATSFKHIEWHATDKKQFLYIYVCKHCHSYFRSTATYATHLLRCSKLLHATTSADSKRKRTLDHMCSICYFCKTTNSEVIYFNGINAKCNNCGEKLIFKYNAINDNDFDILWRTEPCEEQKEYLKCLLCNCKVHFEEIANHYNYSNCKYNNANVVLDNLNYQDTVSSDSSNKKKSKSMSSKSSSFSDTDNSIQLEEPVPFRGIYNCKLCDYQNIDRNDFHSHIVGHRDVSTAYQCMECGECFVVKPSLIKHLLFYHEISDIDDYFNENNCFDKEAVKELELSMRLTPGQSKEPVAENQCRVCRLQFTDSLELKKHFRVHGMAFLLNNSK